MKQECFEKNLIGLATVRYSDFEVRKTPVFNELCKELPGGQKGEPGPRYDDNYGVQGQVRCILWKMKNLNSVLKDVLNVSVFA